MTFRISHQIRKTRRKPFFFSCVALRVALAELRVSGKSIPNQAMLINSIPLLEAQASSEIEHIVTTTGKLFRYANDAAGHSDPETKDALRYRTSLSCGFEMLKEQQVSTGMAVKVCRTIKGGGSGYSKDAGKNVEKRSNRLGHLHGAGRRGRSLKQTGKPGELHSRGRADRPTDPACRHALSVRGNPPVRRRKRPDRTHAEPALSGRQGPSRHSRPLSQVNTSSVTRRCTIGICLK